MNNNKREQHLLSQPDPSKEGINDLSLSDLDSVRGGSAVVSASGTENSRFAKLDLKNVTKFNVPIKDIIAKDRAKEARTYQLIQQSKGQKGR